MRPFIGFITPFITGHGAHLVIFQIAHGMIPPINPRKKQSDIPIFRMGVAAAPYGKKLGQMLADDEVAKNPGVCFVFFWRK